MRKTLTVPLVVLVVMTGTVIAVSSTGVVIDSFEDGNVSEWDIDAGCDVFNAEQEAPINGSWNLNVSEDTGDLCTGDRSMTTPNNNSSVWINMTQFGSESLPSIIWTEAFTGNFALIQINSTGAVHYFDGSSKEYTGLELENKTYYRFTVSDLDYTNDTYDFAVYAVNGTQLTTHDDINGRVDISGINTFGFQTRGGAQFKADYLTIDGKAEFPSNGVVTDLELEIDPWMPFDSTQDYQVILNETNTTSGHVNLTDVTADADVTIQNVTNTTGFSGPIATVNNTTDTIRSYNQTGVVNVSATYDGEQVNATNVTVGERNLTNIGIMPPEEWVCSFLECDSPTGPHNIGSTVQWLLLVIVIMSTATRFAENPWAGVGTGIMFSILVWVLGYIDLGSVLVTVFSGLLIGALMARINMGRGVTRDNEQSGIAASRGQNRR